MVVKVKASYDPVTWTSSGLIPAWGKTMSFA